MVLKTCTFVALVFIFTRKFLLGVYHQVLVHTRHSSIIFLPVSRACLLSSFPSKRALLPLYCIFFFLLLKKLLVLLSFLLFLSKLTIMRCAQLRKSCCCSQLGGVLFLPRCAVIKASLYILARCWCSYSYFMQCGIGNSIIKAICKLSSGLMMFAGNLTPFFFILRRKEGVFFP